MAASETSPPAKARKRRLLSMRVLLLVSSTLVSLLIGEVLCRVLIPQQTSIRFQQDVDELDGLKLHEAVRMIENDPDLFWRLSPDVRIPEEQWPFFGVISNNQSLREDHDIPREKPPDQKRILFLGDSCTFGYGVAHDAAYVEVAEAILKQDGLNVECINAGVPGYSLFQGHQYLITHGLALEPDLVVLNFGWNDSGMWDHLGDREHHEIIKAMQPPALLSESRLCHLVWGRLNKPEDLQVEGERRPRMLPAEFADTLKQTHALLEKRNIPMLVLLWPLRMNADPSTPPEARTELQIEMMRFGAQNPLSADPSVEGLLDLVALSRDLVRQHGVDAIYYDQGHVTPLGHRAIARSIVDHLEPWMGK